MNSKIVEAIPLGGLGEFGMNMMVLRYGEQMIVIDAGLMFPDEELLGIDIMVPDISFLIENASQVKAFLLTHGHEDHIGGLPFVLPALMHVPVYGTRYTLGLVKGKLEEHSLLDQAKLVTVKPRQVEQIGDFRVEFIHVTHSIVDAVMLAITTPAGAILHTGDFKIDSSPLDGQVMDLPTIAEYGSRGVLALFADSTNSERSGFTPSETTVIERLDEIFHHARKKVVVCCFTSSIHRIQIVLDLAQKYNRKVVLGGRSMLANTKIASELGFLKIPDAILIRPQEARKLPPERVAMLMTGSQGEPMAALPRLAVDNYKNIVIEPDDSVIISARVIPGNEKTISRMINHIYKHDAHVYYDDGSLPPVHVSGHASAEELKLLLNLVRPKFFVPIHGEYRQLFRHAELAKRVRAVKNKVLIAETGDRIQFSEEDAQIVGKVPVGRIFIDEGSLDEVEEIVMRDRRHLAEDGIVLPVLAINKATGKLEGQVEIITRGFIFVDEEDSLMSDSKGRVLQTLEESTFEEATDWAVIKEKIRTDLRRFLFKQTSKRPLVLPVILEI
ncbi:MAG: ribonuclease J [Acidobacteria bacterium]|nr:ribonuclease J [Acidobacteriota bacterium]MCI0623107.1 ribonuclease J [Acidobacteriota bacterium]MCI0720830.1 ribonuclease J [Acidobacteriota bacterium]